MLKPSKKAIGIFGGSFDPPHKGHVEISKISLKKIEFIKIYWIITRKNPFKNKTFFSLNQRIKKSINAVKKLKNIEVLYLDNKIKSSRMIKIINYFIKVKKQNNIYLILGSDNVIKFHKWKSWKKIVKLTKLVVFSRSGYDRKGKKSIVAKYLKKKLININNKPIIISSSILKKKMHKK